MELKKETLDLLTLGMARLLDATEQLERDVKNLVETQARLERKINQVLLNQAIIGKSTKSNTIETYVE
jgi:hypothetical protein